MKKYALAFLFTILCGCSYDPDRFSAPMGKSFDQKKIDIAVCENMAESGKPVKMHNLSRIDKKYAKENSPSPSFIRKKDIFEECMIEQGWQKNPPEGFE